MEVQQSADEFRERYEHLGAEIGKVIVGAQEIVEGVLTCLFAGGHSLLEGVPGLGKTMLVRTLSEVFEYGSEASDLAATQRDAITRIMLGYD